MLFLLMSAQWSSWSCRHNDLRLWEVCLSCCCSECVEVVGEKNNKMDTLIFLILQLVDLVVISRLLETTHMKFTAWRVQTNLVKL